MNEYVQQLVERNIATAVNVFTYVDLLPNDEQVLKEKIGRLTNFLLDDTLTVVDKMTKGNS